MWLRLRGGATVYVDSELSCPVLAAHHMSASSAFVLLVGEVGKPEAVHAVHKGRR
jgi:hypothetical protein